jgi:hypothetical protein
MLDAGSYFSRFLCADARPLIFDQVPEIWIWPGAFVVFLAVFYNAYMERNAAP